MIDFLKLMLQQVPILKELYDIEEGLVDLMSIPVIGIPTGITVGLAIVNFIKKISKRRFKP